MPKFSSSDSIEFQWRPSVFDDSGLLQSHQHLLSFLGNFMSEGQVEEDKVEENDSAGWRDDMKEMDLPRLLVIKYI